MKKLMLLITICLLVLTFIGCARRVNEVEWIEIRGLDIQEYYRFGDDYLLTGVEVEVKYVDDPQTQVLSVDDTRVSLRGNGLDADALKLDTTTTGEKTLRISVGGVSVAVQFSVVYYLVEPHQSLKDLYDSIVSEYPERLDDIIYIGPGNHTVSAQIDVTEMMHFIGPIYDTAKLISDPQARIFNISASDVVIKNLTLTTVSYGTSATGLIEVRTGGFGLIVENNILFGAYSAEYNYSQMHVFGVRVEDNVGGTNLITVENNVIYNVRQSIQLKQSGSTNIGIIRNNNIFHTKGGILINPANEAVAAAQVWEGNFWTATVPGFRDHNEWDIVFHTDKLTGNYMQWHSYNANLTLSTNNGNGFVLDRRWCEYDETHCPYGIPSAPETVYNRTHVMIKYQTSALNPFYDNSITHFLLGHPTHLGAECGNVRQPIWVTHQWIGAGNPNAATLPPIGESNTDWVAVPAINQREESILMAAQAITPGGKIMEWNTETSSWVEIPTSDYPS